MKKTIIIALMLSLLTLNIVAQMRYCPFNNLMYSHPETPNINQDEYRLLIGACALIERRMKAAAAKLSKKNMLVQLDLYLKAVGSSTALRLLDDIKENYVYSSNGSFLRKIYL